MARTRKTRPLLDDEIERIRQRGYVRRVVEIFEPADYVPFILEQAKQKAARVPQRAGRTLH